MFQKPKTVLLKEPGKVPNKNYYYKNTIIYFTNSKLLENNIINKISQNFVTINNISTNTNLQSKLIEVKNNPGYDFTNKTAVKKNSKLNQQTYLNIQNLLKMYHKNIKNNSFYKYQSDKTKIIPLNLLNNILNQTKKIDNDTLIDKASLFIIDNLNLTDENIPKLFSFYYFLSKESKLNNKSKNEMNKLKNQLSLNEQNEINKNIQYIKNKINKTQSGGFINKLFKKDNSNNKYSFYNQIKKNLLNDVTLNEYHKSKLNYYNNIKERNETIKYLFDVMSVKDPLIDTAVILTLYDQKPKLTNILNKNMSKDIKNIEILTKIPQKNIIDNTINDLIKNNMHNKSNIQYGGVDPISIMILIGIITLIIVGFIMAHSAYECFNPSDNISSYDPCEYILFTFPMLIAYSPIFIILNIIKNIIKLLMNSKKNKSTYQQINKSNRSLNEISNNKSNISLKKSLNNKPQYISPNAPQNRPSNIISNRPSNRLLNRESNAISNITLNNTFNNTFNNTLNNKTNKKSINRQQNNFGVTTVSNL